MPLTEFLVSVIKLRRFSNLLLGIAIFYVDIDVYLCEMLVMEIIDDISF